MPYLMLVCVVCYTTCLMPECLLDVLYANLVAARQWLATLLPRETEADGKEVSWVDVP